MLKEDRVKLAEEYRLVALTHAKLRNQHRNQHWWKYFSIFNRRLHRLISLPTSETEADGYYLVHRLIPKLSRQIHVILAQGAFIALGFAVMALVAKVYAILEPSFPKRVPNHPTTTVPKSTEDFGVPVTEEHGEPALSRLKSEKGTNDKKKKKRRNKTNAIDAIFG